ncbi:MAG: Na+:solute symporter [Bacteroidales bacterium]|nr:Na+:solute symporter [Bacteroidales bacterium]
MLTTLTTADWIVIGMFFTVIVMIALMATRKSKGGVEDYFLGGRKMPWWLLGVSMVACTFSADTPNLVTGMVRESGVAKNWAWWSFLITGMATVFIFARLWRRTGIVTDLEFYEKRYSGKAASFLRGFRSIYLGLFFNVLIIGSVTLAAIKIGSIIFGLSPTTTVIFGSLAAVLYTAFGGFRGVVWADFFQYFIAMLGAVVAAVAALNLPEVGGLEGLVSNPAIQDKIDFLPDFSNPSVWVPMLLIPVAVQWWSVWYPGAEPGGGGYMCQKMLSAQNEQHSVAANMLFNFAHYALRPWPWIIVGLASLIIFQPDTAAMQQQASEQLTSPEINQYYNTYLQNYDAQAIPESIRDKVVDLHFQKEGLSTLHKAFPDAHPQYLKNDAAYPIMVTKTGAGWFGLIIASLIAAYMSTIGTHLNWGASYLVNDFYKRFVKPEASDRELKNVAILCTVVLAVLGGVVALTVMDNATQAFDILLLSGAGTGAVYLLRWFWWRINAATEISAMVSAFVMSIIMVFAVPDGCLANSVLDHSTTRLLITVTVVTIIWLATVYITKPENPETLRQFYALTRPGGPGWKKVVADPEIDATALEPKDAKWDMPLQILCVFIGIITIYACLFAGGFFVMLRPLAGTILSIVAVSGAVAMWKISKKIKLR